MARFDQLKRSVAVSNFTDAERTETLRSADIWVEPLKTREVLAMPEAVFINTGSISRPPVRRRRRLSRRRPAKTDWSLTLEAFERLLRWLSPDHEAAGRKYERIRTKMVRFFNWRGCHNPEELFDRTIDRACSKIQLGAHELHGDAMAFCYGVGRFILQEHWREVKLNPLPEDVLFPEIKDPEKDEREFEQFEILLNRLSQRDRDLILAYYQGEGRERIQRRKDLAAALGGTNALRIQVFRIRAKLRAWIADRAPDEDEKEKLSLYPGRS